MIKSSVFKCFLKVSIDDFDLVCIDRRFQSTGADFEKALSLKDKDVKGMDIKRESLDLKILFG